jgi:hypothetical protein
VAVLTSPRSVSSCVVAGDAAAVMMHTVVPDPGAGEGSMRSDFLAHFLVSPVSAGTYDVLRE